MPELWKTRRREILAGGACLLLLLAVFLFMPRHEGTEEPSDIGTMRIEEVLAAHPSYAQLQELRAEERSLTLLVRDMPAPPEIKPPEAEAAPFDDSVWQKNAQTVISTRVELERERKRLAEVYRKQTEADYEARKKAIDDEYLNAILNINLKIDNQRAMHGPRVSEEELAAERAVWEREREELKRERGARQMALYREWQAQIRARVAARIEPQQAAWTRRAQETINAQKAEAERLQKEAQSRNADEMGRALKEREENSAAVKRALRLAAVRNEADALEAQIWRDVRSRAAKLAIMHHFSLVLASPEESAGASLPAAELFAVRRFAPLIANTATDVTAEMVHEMQSIKE
jgi:hypothetical protein